MGIGETLQDALVNANYERIKWHDIVQAYDRELVQLKAALQLAETEKAGAAMIHKAAEHDRNELLEHRNRQTDERARTALSGQLENLAQKTNFAVHGLRVAGAAVNMKQQQTAKVEAKRASALMSLTIATEDWEQIKRQIHALNSRSPATPPRSPR